MIKKYVEEINSPVDSKLTDEVNRRLDDLTKPRGSLGRLEDFVVQYCTCRNSPDSEIVNPLVLTFAADHGITENGITPYPSDVTAQMVQNMASGGAAVSVMARQAGYRYAVIDVGVKSDLPEMENLIIRKVRKATRNFAMEPAMTDQEALLAVEYGREMVDVFKPDLLGLGEMGIGNSSSASALYSLLLEIDPRQTVGPGTGSVGKILEKKVETVGNAVAFHAQQWDKTAWDALRRVGGLEIAALVGAILGACAKRVPVVIDGFICSAAALIAMKLSPVVREYLYFSHISHEPFHRKCLEKEKITPMLDFRMRLGEGTGAVLAMQILQQAVACYRHMATFSSASVSRDSGEQGK